MKWITGILAGLGVGFVIGVITIPIAYVLFLVFAPYSENNPVTGLFYAAIFGSIAGVIAGVVAFGWYVSPAKSEANAQAAANQIEAPVSLIEQPEMGTCIYCGKEINEETAICDDCLKG